MSNVKPLLQSRLFSDHVFKSSIDSSKKFSASADFSENEKLPSMTPHLLKLFEKDFSTS